MKPEEKYLHKQSLLHRHYMSQQVFHSLLIRFCQQKTEPKSLHFGNPPMENELEIQHQSSSRRRRNNELQTGILSLFQVEQLPRKSNRNLNLNFPYSTFSYFNFFLILRISHVLQVCSSMENELEIHHCNSSRRQRNSGFHI